jgi:hypothetical protein
VSGPGQYLPDATEGITRPEDAFEAIAENLSFELGWGNGIQRILAATAGSMLVSWLSLAVCRRVLPVKEMPANEENPGKD